MFLSERTWSPARSFALLSSRPSHGITNSFLMKTNRNTWSQPFLSFGIHRDVSFSQEIVDKRVDRDPFDRVDGHVLGLVGPVPDLPLDADVLGFRLHLPDSLEDFGGGSEKFLRNHELEGDHANDFGHLRSPFFAVCFSVSE